MADVRLSLMRHGRTAWNRAGRIQGRTDIPLDDEAREELSQLALPEGFEADQVVASPLLRARQTAELVAGRAPVVEDALLEMDWGDWEGQAGADLRRDPSSGYTDIEHWGWGFCPPAGEPLSDLRARLERWLAVLDQDTVAISHIGVMRVCLALASGWNFQGPAPFAVKRNRLYVLQRRDGKWSMTPEPIRLRGRIV